MRILNIQWPVIITVTVINYAMIILLLPFNPVLATVFLFGLIGFWSRLPGAGINDPLFIFYATDLVDIFALIITINLGWPVAAAFVWIVNTLPRLAGIYPPWSAIIEDNAAQSITCMITPLIYSITGDILVTMAVYTTVRNLIMLPTSYFLRPRPFIEWAASWVAWFIAIYLVNTFYAKIFGGYFDSLLQNGASFDWILFLFASIVIFGVGIVFFKLSPGRFGKKVGKGIVRFAKSKIARKPSSHDLESSDLDVRFVKETLRRL
ncbi:hypothetical protein H6503_05675 [Candidatus Woesearchaeota archaeon]|nr:hypothetical protein [Candidatus Woesearchaeota archaeon]